MTPEPLTVLVTGGASGIGFGIVRTLLSSTSPTYNVLIVDRSSASFPSLLSSLASSFGEERLRRSVECVAADVTRYEELRDAFEKARRKSEGWSERVDAVCAIAGISQVFTDAEGKDPFLRSAKLDEDGLALAPNLAVISVNLVGVLNTVHLAISHFRSQKPNANGWRGRIVCAGSTASLYPFPNESLYGAAKHGVLGVVRSLAPALQPEGISINAIAPSLVETGIGNPEAFAALRDKNCLTPMETVTRAVQVLIEPDGRLTGQLLECCLSSILLRLPPRLPNYEETRCMDMIWPWKDIERSVFGWRSEEGEKWLRERGVEVVQE
ncbi:short-chain dehydrogenase/reductase SDR family protein [Rhodotorula toruloides]|uniref:Short-chain dehydrogenase/reductase SDR family protein n=1 Tax=Rhodotorula toruloides TaxID=5286 RepID=A0A511KQQ2_RHOTO|nr:short-chain dehydrogenase/reductase SDR family protein [Rhodotorula toruloides]